MMPPATAAASGGRHSHQFLISSHLPSSTVRPAASFITLTDVATRLLCGKYSADRTGPVEVLQCDDCLSRAETTPTGRGLVSVPRAVRRRVDLAHVLRAGTFKLPTDCFTGHELIFQLSTFYALHARLFETKLG